MPGSGRSPRWMSITLWLAAAYNLAWGAWVVIWPNAWFDMAGVARPLYPQVWQCVGMVVGVYGVGYAIAATDPIRWWPIVLVGFLGKLLGPFGMALAVYRDEIPLSMTWVNVTNDLVWWLPFGMILWAAWGTRD